MDQLEVPVKNEKGETVREPLNPSGPQSDGSIWNQPRALNNHDHYFKLKSPDSREAVCECGMGGYVYPHNAKIIEGHIYKLDNTKVI